MPPTADSPDAVLAAEQAAEATCLFALADFDASHQTLQRIEATLPPSSDDPRVQFNLWTVGYYADASTSLDSVTKELEGWLKAHPAAQPADPTQQNGHAVAAINYGLLLFLQQQHASALAVLEPLFEDVDLLQDGAGLCLCVLLLEIYFDSCQLPKAVQVLQYLQGLPAAATAGRASSGAAGGAGEAAAGDGGGAGTSGGSSSSQQSPQKQQAGGDRSPPQKQSQQQHKGGHGGSSSSAGGGGGSSPKAGGQQRESQGGAGAGEEGQEGKAALVPLSQALPVLSKTRSQFMQQVSTLVQQQGGKLPACDLGPLLHMYKARLAVACNNHKAAKKEVRGLLSCCPPPSSGADSSAAAAAAAGGLLLKAQLEVGRHQPRRALKALGPLLSGSNNIQASNRCRLQLLNLLAAVHHQLGKHHVAALYLSTAINLHAELQQQQQQPKLLTNNTSEPQQQQPQQQQRGRQQGKKQQKKQQGSRAASSDPGSTSAASTGRQESGAAGSTARQSHWLLEDASDALSYNLGLQQLALEDWQGAMESFEAAAARYFSLPQLWLRWAEACLGMYHQKQQEQYMLAQQPQQQPQQQTLANNTAASTAEAATEGAKTGKAGASTSAAAGRAGKGQAGKKQQQPQQPQQQEPQQQQQQQEVVAAALTPEQLLQQAVAHLSTGLVLLQEQQAAAARQLEAATAAVAAAVAAGEPPPDFESSAWALAALGAHASGVAGAGGPAGGTAAAAPAGDPGAASSSAAALSSAAPATAGGGGRGAPSTPTAGHSTMLAPSSGSWLPEAALLAPELVAVRQSLLANQAYVHLLMGQPGEALAAAQELVAASSMSPQQHYLGSSYAAEALCLLGRVDEARQQLQSHMERFAHIGSSAGGVASGGAVGQQQQQHAGAADGPTPPAADAAATASGAVGATPAVAGSTKSYDGSCISCSRGVCGHGSSAWDASGADAAAAAIQPFDQAAMLHNMGAVLMLQGDQQEGYRHAAMAAALVNAAQQQHNS